MTALLAIGLAVAIDGDTLNAAGIHIRLQGIAAPELSEPGGLEARAWKPRSRYRYPSTGPELYLLSVRWESDCAYATLEGPRHLPFEMPCGGRLRGVQRIELLKAGVFKIPANYARAT